MFDLLYDYSTGLRFVGGIFTLLLGVTIVYGKQELKRDHKRKRLEQKKERDPDFVGDIEEKLNQIEYRSFNYLELLVEYGLQPLLIVSFINLIDNHSSQILIIAFGGLLILFLAHEFWLRNKYKDNWFYRLLVLALWFGFFFIFSYYANQTAIIPN